MPWQLGGYKSQGRRLDNQSWVWSSHKCLRAHGCSLWCAILLSCSCHDDPRLIFYTYSDFFFLDICDIGWSIKKYSIKVKKNCTKKWRWLRRELKTWYMWNNIVVFLSAKKYSFYFDLFSWYGHLNVKYWQFWHWPNAFKICSEIVLCLLFLLPKNFYSK